ncbi:carbohydrate ABC transporter permease [Wenjunlia tyrosinilytica]|uniref:Sugar ABC transporter permease n=1 Tax=Wenjunlia tyrosinilytica TaxID=1544741 RepID=A0A918E1A6_9ACTN|nr:carbohydrate ABC transporter permease [Wenjunlia tyrosinilytica]GGP00615.1 sugar ABC transporter permease [Wenjunlia tyrosinilytica]
MSTGTLARTATPTRPGKPPAAPARRRRGGRGLASNLALLAISAVMFFPIYWMAVTAFKPGPEILSYTPHWLPSRFTLDNFTAAVDRPFFWSGVANSLLVVSATVLIALVVAFLGAVALARFEFTGRQLFVAMILVVQMVPAGALIIPIYLMLNRAGQTDQLPGVVLAYLTFVLPFAIWMLRGFVVNVPVELEEAALIDGCNRLQAFRRVLFPLVAPGLVATAVYTAIQAWNEFLLAYVLISTPEKQTMTVWLASFTTTRGTEYGPLMAASTLAALPVVIFFALAQRRVVSGLTAGSVKG